MAKPKVTLNSAGIEKLLKSPQVQADMARRAQNIARVAGEGMRPSSMVGSGRARASVITETHAARRAEARDRRLTRALDAGRS